MEELFASIIWDPHPVFFKVPFLNFSVRWYGFFFAVGFCFSYFLCKKIFEREMKRWGLFALDISPMATKLADQLSLFVILATVIGARLGYVLFYDLPSYIESPLTIFKVWEGGLASHGALIMIVLALYLFPRLNRKTFPQLTSLFCLDALVIVVPLCGALIRLGNFMNQEITGIPSKLPWAVAFMHPMDNVPGLPVHPVQLYESIFYFLLFGVFFFLWKRSTFKVGNGGFTGLLFTVLFSFRFLIEFFKTPQGVMLPVQFPLRMGQVLSIPVIILGVALLYFNYRKQQAQSDTSSS